MEKWSRGTSPLHRRDARVKLLALLFFLVILATTPPSRWLSMSGYFLFLCGAVLLSRLPLRSLLLRAALVLPFSLTVATLSLFSGEIGRAAGIPVKSFLSALAVLVIVATTPLPQILRALERFGFPRMALLVLQFLYRYLFVIFEQAQRMRLAARCRGGFGSTRRSRFRAASGALAVLFGHSYERAEGIHQAMLARGFDGHLRLLSAAHFRSTDAAFLAAAVAVPLALRLGMGR